MLSENACPQLAYPLFTLRIGYHLPLDYDYPLNRTTTLSVAMSSPTQRLSPQTPAQKQSKDLRRKTSTIFDDSALSDDDKTVIVQSVVRQTMKPATATVVKFDAQGRPVPVRCGVAM
ncbi:hypothetical protein PENSPDRAFT_755477 [Peniophora sp. CONT]|nr:hypothetical protein PENSPDRAFT_755477 [Peniophora sp. CONT]